MSKKSPPGCTQVELWKWRRQVVPIILFFNLAHPVPLKSRLCHNRSLTVKEIQDEVERFFLEQARAFYCDMRAVAENAPKGKNHRAVQ